MQSTTMALMAAHGEITPMPDAAVFADTGWEPQNVYDHLKWLRSPNVLPFPVHVVNNGNIRDSLTSTVRGRYAAVPFFLDDGSGKPGMGRRQCTKEYKLQPLRWKFRELLGYDRKQRVPAQSVTVWIGISTDEAIRMKPSGVNWMVNRWPLIEAEMSRHDCKRWMERMGYPQPPKSSCIGCPFHSDSMWRDMRDNDPDAWADAVEVDQIIRTAGTRAVKDIRAFQYIHRSLKPLSEVDLSTPEDHGQLNMFGNECEGLCGV